MGAARGRQRRGRRPIGLVRPITGRQQGRRQRLHAAPVHAAQALVQRRVGLEPVGRGLQQHRGQQPGGHAQQPVFVLQRLVPDLAQHAAQAVAAAGELHRAGVGQQLALARHRRLQHLPGQPTQQAGGDEHRPHQHAKGRAAAGVVGLDQRVAVAVHQRQAPHQREQLHVEPQVTAMDVAELVRHQALQLVTREPLQRAARHGHHRALGRPAGGKGVDGVFALQHVDRRARQAAGQRHLVDHVEQAALRAGRAGRSAAARRPIRPRACRRLRAAGPARPARRRARTSAPARCWSR